MEAINRFIQSRIRNHYIKDCIVLLGGNGLKISLGFLLNVTLAKFFNPAEFGVYSTLMSVSLICVNITDFGYGNTMNRLVNLRGDPNRSILANTFILKAALLAIFLTGLYWFSPLLAGHLKALEGRQSLVRMLVVLVALESLFKFLLSTLQAGGEFSRFSLVLILSNAIRLVGVIFLYFTHRLTFESILMLYMLSSTLLLVLHGGRWKLKFHLRPDLMKQINRFAIWVWLFIVINSFFVKSDILLANFFQYDKNIIGNYALVFYFISLIGLLQDALFTQLLPKTSKFSKREDFIRYYKDIQYIRWTSIALSALYLFALPYVINMIYSGRYHVDGMIVAILGVPFLFSLYNEFNMVLLYAFENHRYISFGNMLGLAGVFTGMIVFRQTRTIAHIAAAVAFGKIACDLFIYYQVKRCYHSLHS